MDGGGGGGSCGVGGGGSSGRLNGGGGKGGSSGGALDGRRARGNEGVGGVAFGRLSYGTWWQDVDTFSCHTVPTVKGYRPEWGLGCGAAVTATGTKG